MALLIIFLLVLLAYCIFFIAQFGNIVFKGNAPAISTDKETIEAIINEIKISKNSKIYELGCGRALFLQVLEKKITSADLLGIENLFCFYLLNKFKLKWRGSRIKLINSDLLNINLQEADIIYCYLNNKTMEKLGAKLRREGKSGLQIISRSFPLPLWPARKVVSIKNKKIYFYEYAGEKAD